MSRRKLTFNKDIIVNSLGDVIQLLVFNSTSYATYYNKEATNFQRTGASRSIIDCFILANTYFPGISYAIVQLAIESFYEYGTLHNPLSNWWCYDTNRRVHDCRQRLTKEYVNDWLDKHNLNYKPLKETEELCMTSL